MYFSLAWGLNPGLVSFRGVPDLLNVLKGDPKKKGFDVFVSTNKYVV